MKPLSMETILNRINEIAYERGDELHFRDDFISKIEYNKSRITSTSKHEYNCIIEKEFSNNDIINILNYCYENNINLSAIIFTLSSRYNNMSTEDIIKIVPVVSKSFDSELGREYRIDNFIPIEAQHIDFYKHLFDKLLIYVWREDCEPCEKVEEELESHERSANSDISLFSVYGPGYASYLYDEYEVVGAPTILFLSGSKVNTRLLGATSSKSIKQEIEYLAH